MVQLKVAILAIGASFALAAPNAGANTIPVVALEVKIELQVLDFIATPGDRSAVAVLYDNERTGSMEQAASLLQSLRDGARQAHSPILPRLVELQALAGATGLKAVILPADLASAAVLDYGVAHQTLVLSSGLDCVRDHHCMVGVAAKPEVEIGVNSLAVHAGRILFADGFQLMVKEY